MAHHGQVKPAPLIHKVVDIWVLVYPDFLLLDATGPVQVFSSANDDARDAKLPQPYRIHLVSKGGGAVTSSSGVAVLTRLLPRSLRPEATLIVSGGRGCGQASADAATVRWIARAFTVVQRCCSVCTGAFMLAEAGLLDHKKAVTHWQDVHVFKQQYPAVLMHDDAIYMKDGTLYTSAGITAGIDLSLSLVEEDLGRPAALSVAKRLVVFLKRPGGQRQYSSELLAQASEEGVTGALTRWLTPRLKQTVGVEQMAAAVALSVRSLHRKLRLEAGASPAQFLMRMRLDSACALLEHASLSIKQVAHQTGFGSEYNLRRAFAAHLGVVPTEYRARFG
ncbi:MAG: helix-turn-helix domain-containing protein [Pseudomonadota bacterium]